MQGKGAQVVLPPNWVAMGTIYLKAQKGTLWGLGGTAQAGNSVGIWPGEGCVWHASVGLKSRLLHFPCTLHCWSPAPHTEVLDTSWLQLRLRECLRNEPVDGVVSFQIKENKETTQGTSDP